MKSSLERVDVIATRHKEVTPLDFYTLFHLTDNSVRARMMKENNTNHTLYLYSNSTQTTTTYLVKLKDDANHTHVLEAMFQIMNDEEFDYYVIITEGWRATDPEEAENELYTPEGSYKGIASLPLHKRRECLTIDGKSKDGKEHLCVVYDIIRVRQEDDSSKIIRFDKLVENVENIKHAELTHKRKWLSSQKEMLESKLAVLNKPDAQKDGLYCCLISTTVDKTNGRVGKLIQIIHEDQDVLHDSIEPLIGEEILAFKKLRNCYDTSVLDGIQLTPMYLRREQPNDKPDYLFSAIISISLMENYNDDFTYRRDLSEIGGKDIIKIFTHRNDDDYSKAEPIKVMPTSEYQAMENKGK